MKRLSLFAHWDPDSIIDDYVIYYINELNRVSDVIFYSDSNLSDKELSKLDGITIKYGSGKHGEYDFGSYKRAYKLAVNDLGKYDQLILANDSCYGPFYPLDDLLKEAANNNYDYWGLTTYRDHKYGNVEHIQSYFMVLNKNIFSSSQFDNFILNIEKKSSKKDIITSYEIGLSKLLDELNFKKGAKLEPNNQNLAYQSDCITLIKDSQFPLLKRELLTKNPYNSPDLIGKLCEISKRQKGKAIICLIMAHISRVNPKAVNKWNIPSSRKTHITLLHRKIFRIKFHNSNSYIQAKIKIMGLSLLKVPVRRSLNIEQAIKRLNLTIRNDGTKSPMTPLSKKINSLSI